ncbi:DUF3307 domain-containing protein [Aquirufa salirivi]|uniref:DUF3307 domain-containing protein n=1 Tax=Aquirufa salirivi TaxID=3104729 RepID=A0ABW8RZL2_9BACT
MLAHFIGDFVLQSNQWVKHKEEHLFKSPYLYLHVCLHTMLMFMVVGFEYVYIPAIVFLSITHLIVDGIKLMKPIKNHRLLFFLDQSVHIILLYWVSQDWSTHFEIQTYVTERNLLLVLAIILLTSVTSIVLKVVFSIWDKDLEKISEKDSSLKDAGRYIGMLERLFVFAFILLDQWDAIGFLLAAKSVFRFGDLTKAGDRKLTEYILIGTLLSFGIAMIIGVAFLTLTK